MYKSIKTYGNDRGLSCCFRQWRANHSHCSRFHGYSIGVEFTFRSKTLDEKHWCFDFGNMRPIKEYLDYMFDHTTLIAIDDPDYPEISKLASYDPIAGFDNKLIDIRLVDAVGCEAFAKMIFDFTKSKLIAMKNGEHTRYPINFHTRIESVKVFEHGANAAIYSEE